MTGNLDANDLNIIDENMDKLYSTQNSNIEKINQLTTLANHITDTIAKETTVLNKNLRITWETISSLQKAQDYQIQLQNEITQAKCLLNTLQMIQSGTKF